MPPSCTQASQTLPSPIPVWFQILYKLVNPGSYHQLAGFGIKDEPIDPP